MNSRILATVVSGLILASCGAGGSDSPPPPSTGSVSTATPTPAVTYRTYDELAGDQNFKTSCVSFILGSRLLATPATSFGDGFALAYAATPANYTIAGNGLSLAYGPADVDLASSTAGTGYSKLVNGFRERFIISRPSPGNRGLLYTREFSLITQRESLYQYSCIFGVPTLVSDTPAATSVSFTRLGVNGGAYRTEGGATAYYSLERSTVTFNVDLTTGATIGTINLIGTLRTAAGAGPELALGSYSVRGEIDADKGSYSGFLTDPSSPMFLGTFGGWFFGPQGSEAGYVFSISDVNKPSRVELVAVGRVTAAR